jgi:hypothetical protein
LLQKGFRRRGLPRGCGCLHISSIALGAASAQLAAPNGKSKGLALEAHSAKEESCRAKNCGAPALRAKAAGLTGNNGDLHGAASSGRRAGAEIQALKS